MQLHIFFKKQQCFFTPDFTNDSSHYSVHKNINGKY